MRNLRGPSIQIDFRETPKMGRNPRTFASVLLGATASAWLTFAGCQLLPPLTYASFSLIVALAFTILTVGAFAAAGIAVLIWKGSFRIVSARPSDFL